MAANGNFGQQDQHKGGLESYPQAPASNNEAGSDKLNKDQIGWYFVEQFYTTLSKNPEKLHLFYNKQSQFVSGKEAEIANVSVGRLNIQERIKELDFQDCKVRVSNVDSQASFDNIVIQVIGETSNKSQEPKKFVQTFVLAEQPSGYYVLNDILRYIDEDAEEGALEQAVEVAAPEPEAAAEEPAAVEAEVAPKAEESAPVDAKVVDEKLESAKVNGKSEEAVPAVEKSAPASEEAAKPEEAARELAEEASKEAEKPKDPAPTPAPKAAEAAPAAPAEPAGPPKPMTWASRAAAAAGPRPVVPLPKTATPPAPAQSRAPAAAAPAAAPAAPAASAAPAAAAAPAKESSEWQTAGDAKRQNRPQSTSTGPAEKEGTMGYVKFVTDKVQDAELKSALNAHGEVTYFDINRTKNCAFVEFKTAEGCAAAIAASPLTVAGENLVIEPRRPKSTAYGGANYGRGGAPNRGRGGFEGGRSGGNPRGNFGGQGRGGRGGAPRGARTGGQPTNV